MREKSTEVRLSTLAAHLRDAYGLAITAIVPVPKGEDADAYRAATVDGASYFVRVQPAVAAGHLKVALAATAALRVQCGLESVVDPLPTTQGAVTSDLDTAVVAVFPFVDGITAYERDLGDADWQRLAATMAEVHESGACCRLPELPRESFGNPFASIISDLLPRANADRSGWSPWQRRMAALLQDERVALEATLRQFARRGDQARQVEIALVLTHGDPNLANVLVSDTGSLHLIDWGALAYGPRERDLMFYTGDRFAAFMGAYLARTGPVRLHLDLFAFYQYRWALQEIADYGTNILLTPGDAETQAYAWQEVQAYLPLPHAAIAAEVAAVRQALETFVREGQVDLREEAFPA